MISRMKTTDTNTNNDATNNSIKVLLDQNNIPIEELLGSVTTYNNVEGSDSKSQQLRTSARVFKKMKLDSTPLAVPTTVSEKKEPVKEESKVEVKRYWRPNWSQEDKNLFFEALNEFGKDFEAIHSQISSKLKKKGLPDSVIKTKDQVRHFYYRTWHKISKHLKFSEDVKKLAQELYGLINYGELRKKIGSVSEKACMKLNELIYRGHVSFRLKGKTIRVKTPVCRALRRLNQIDDKHEDLKLPLRVNVELVPKEMNAWLKVQSVSQNPRIRASLSLHKRLNTLLKFLSLKWKTVDATAYENIISTPSLAVVECVPDKRAVDETISNLDPLLRLTPPPNIHVEPATFNLSEYITSNSICLNAYEERFDVKSPGELLWVTKASRKGGTKRVRNESNCEKTSPPVKQTPPTNTTDNNENCINDIDDVNEAAVNTILMLQSQNQEEATGEEIKDKIETGNEITSEEIREKNINIIRQGWNISNCGNLSIGELYLMFGSNSQLVLEYSWDDSESLVKVENCDKIESETCVNSINENKLNDESLTGSLKSLLSIATLRYQKNVNRCTCGHVCGSGGKSNTQSKTALNKSNVKTELVEKPAAVETKVTTETATVVPSVVPITIQPSIGEYTKIDTFRRPFSPSIDSLRAQLDRLKPRYCNRRGRRPRLKQVVVERRLPLLPNKIDNGHQIVQMNIISTEDRGNTLRTIAPTILKIDKTEHNISVEPGPSTAHSISESVNTTINFGSLNVSQSSSSTNTETNVINISDNAVTPSRVSSPTSISNLLDMALGGQSNSMENKNSINSFAGILSNATPSTSPLHILKEGENQWLNSEVADFSLSSFLGRLDSPVKPQTDDNNLSQAVDAQLQSLLTESSIDYMTSFADLAAQVNFDSTQK